MLSSARAARYDRDQRRVAELAQREIDRTWLGISSLSPVDAKELIADLALDLVDTFGPIAAALAADFYEEVRLDEGIQSPHSVIVANAPVAEKVASSAFWASQPLFDGKPIAARARLLGAVQRHVQQAGRDTLFQNGDNDRARPRWARRPDGNPCKWCSMLASRGAVYLSEDTAGGFNDWHDDCNCQPEMSFDGEVSYDLDAAIARYVQGV